MKLLKMGLELCSMIILGAAVFFWTQKNTALLLVTFEGFTLLTVTALFLQESISKLWKIILSTIFIMLGILVLIIYTRHL